MPGTIEPNSWLLLRLPSENNRVLKLVPGTSVGLGKFGSFRADNLIGQKFGYTYEITGDKSVQQVEPPSFDAEDNEEDVTSQTMTGDQIDYLGTNTLSMEEIEQLKREGKKGEDIIEKIINSHQDFDKKTEFAKAKYLKRKKMKYLQHFTPEPITSQQLLEIYTEKDRSRVMNMGMESLAMLLSLANVRPGGHYLVVDETPSLIVVAILEKLNGQGSVTIVHENEHTNLDALKYFEQWYPEENPKIEHPLVRTVNMLELFAPQDAFTEDDSEPKPENFGNADPKELKTHQRGQYNRHLYRYRQREFVRSKCAEGYDGLIVASTLELTDLVPRLIPFVSGSAPIVVYSEFKERLVDLTLAAKHDLRMLAPTIWETRVRRYQTLPGRIHPKMTSLAVGGYLLHALRVYPSESVHALGVGAQRKKRRRNDEDSREASMEVEN